jgi:hypothetical protein
LNITALATQALPGFERQLGDVFHGETLENGNPFLFHPTLIACLCRGICGVHKIPHLLK